MRDAFRSPYLRAQVVGWSLFATLRFAGILAEKSLDAACETLPHLLLKTSIACAASFALGAIYRRGLQPRGSLRAAATLIVPSCLIAGVAVELSYQWIGVLAFPDEPVVYLPKEMVNQAVLMLAWSALWVGLSWRRDLEREREHALRADALAAEARLQMLRYQVNPHFLFNALNAVRALVEIDPPGARRMITQLAEFFRYSLLHTGTPWARLGDEIDAVRNYLAIQATRFADRLATSIDVPPGANDLRVPAFVIHALVENAIKYGMETSPMPLAVHVGVERREGWLEVTVENTGRWVATASPGHGTGTGLANVRHRLELLLPGRYRFETAERHGRVRATLEIPAERAE
ncbi:MAG TPA: histidine kinase [Candidatus Polarisedimenticolaceae bacterium]